ncbi:efflux RND transporter permease subunit [Salinisphaera hydrothermalis]|uniref:Efflux pump membrane transporter n=1 Tax=Salinisphaera hydrothermalis (strain C41B8) TaxID=1304275 RepID=A0A084IIL0_SALHC|nr:efflux RND transporter permease subunit [Salinisphaera hydrothermalis]KEZ76544.1 cation/multidrug efflux pump protein [Salinisphaera hydrothermalis C41B8]
MSRFFIDRPIFATVLAIIVSLAGALAIFTLPLEQYPEIAPPTISVAATYTGANAETTQNSVTQIIEQSMTGLDNLLYIESSSDSSGESRVRLTFASGTNPDIAQVQVQNELQRAIPRLPASVQQQGVRTYQSGGNYFLVFALSSTDGSMDEADIGDYIASTLTDPLSRVSGISQARNFGAEYALRIWLDPHKLNQYHLMPSDIRAALESQNANVSAGQLGGLPQSKGQQFTATITARSRLTSVDQFKHIIVKSNPDGSVVRLSDVARVEIGSDEYSEIARFNGRHAAGLGLELAAGANAMQTAQNVEKRLEELSQFFPPGLEAHVAFDTTPFVRASIEEVVKTLFEAVLLVVAIMFLFLQSLRATLVPALAVPVVLLGTFGVLAIFGYSINTLTMFALVLAIGLLVDDAIVVVENVERVMAERGLSPRDATIASMGEIQGALIGIALVLSAVFVPMAFFPGSTGVIYRQFAVTIASAMVLSVGVALILTPALCASLLKPIEKRRPPGRVFTAFNRGVSAAASGSQRIARRLIHARALVMLVFAGIVLAVAWLFTHLPSAFLPNEDQGVLMVSIQLPPGATANRTVDAIDRVTDYFKSRPNVKSIFAIASSDGQNTGRAFVHLVDWRKRTGVNPSSEAIAARATAALSKIRDARIYVLSPPALRNLGDSSGFELELEDVGGVGRDALTAAREQFLKLARADDKLAQMRADTTNPNAQFAIDIDDAEARAHGLAIADINSTLSAAFGGSYVDDFIYHGRVKRVYMEGDTPYRMQPADVNDWYVRNTDGDMVPFSAFSTAHWTTGLPELERYNGVAAYQISGQPAPGVSSSDAMAEVKKLVAQLPEGIGYEWSGISFQQQQAGSQAPLLYAVSIGFVFLCLAALYESWSIPIAVMLVVPLGVLGALLAILMRGMPIDVYFQVGLLTTIGLSAKNAILIVEYAHQLERAGESLMDAALHAVRLRLRPILMTSLAFGMGVFPLMISTGAGAGARNSVGTGVFGGMVAATALAIFFVPVFFVLSRAGWRRLTADGRVAR